MRIVLVASEFITEHSFTGGLANYMYRTAKILQSFGHEVVVVCSAGANKQIIYEGIPVHQVSVVDQDGWKIPNSWLRVAELRNDKYYMAVHTIWQSRQLNKEVAKIHKEKPIDIIHYAHLGAVALCKPRGIPAVIRLSSSTRLCHEYGGYGTTDTYIRQQEFLERRAYKRAKAIFGPSHFIARYVTKEIGRDISVIESPFFQDVEQEDPSIYEQHLADKKYLLFFGSIGHIKGVGTIAKIIHSLLSQHPDFHFAFVGQRLVGQEGGDLMDQVFHSAAEHRGRVYYIEPQRHDKLYPIIRHAHTVVLPSRIDNFPNACIEAMSFKKLVIGTRGNGFEQLIDHGRSGLLCTVDDPKDLRQNIEIALLMSDVERSRIGDNAAKRIEDLHPEKVGRELVDLYTSVIRK